METQVFFRAEEVIYLYLSFFLQATVRLTGSKNTYKQSNKQ